VVLEPRNRKAVIVVNQRPLFPYDPDQLPAAPRDPTAGKHGGAPESIAAWEQQKQHLAADQAAVLELIREAGANGMTSKEIAARLGKPLHAISGRLTELAHWEGGALIRRNGEQRRDGAAVWVANL
jgi:hypothetical protein